MNQNWLFRRYLLLKFAMALPFEVASLYEYHGWFQPTFSEVFLLLLPRSPPPRRTFACFSRISSSMRPACCGTGERTSQGPRLN
jgi:hypothetical protein